MTSLRRLMFAKAASGGSGGGWRTATGAVASFIATRSTALPMEFDLVPIQAGTGDPSPENKRPITGHDGFTRIRTGKNLLEVTADNLNKPSYYSGKWSGTSVASGENAITVTMGNGQGGFGGIVLPEGLPAGEYYLSCDVNAEGTKYFYYGYQRMDGTYSGQKSLATSGRTTTHPNHAFTLEEPVKSIFFKMSVANDLTPCTFSNLMVRESDSGTDFEAPSIQSYETEFPTPPGTVYGGHIKDNGDGTYDLTVDRYEYTFTGNEKFLTNTSAWGEYAFLYNTGVQIQSSINSKPLCKSSHFVLTDSGGWSSLVPGKYMTAGTYYICLGFDGTKDELKAWLASQASNNTPVQVVCGLTTPVTYTLSLDIIRSLIGQNNIWVDNADSVSVEYWGH